jgi:hypothetical protein
MSITIKGALLIPKPSDESHGDIDIAYVLGGASGDSSGVFISELLQEDTHEDTLS